MLNGNIEFLELPPSSRVKSHISSMEPISFASSIAGLLSLLDLVATKGYKYVKAVKDCEEEVKQLVVELDVFGGVLQRLTELAKEEEEVDGCDAEGL